MSSADKFEMKVCFDENGWHIFLYGTEAGCQWRDAVKLRETRNLIMLFRSPRESDTIPKRCLTQEQIEQIRVLWNAGRSKKGLGRVPRES